jgi:hypothetical protein
VKATYWHLPIKPFHGGLPKVNGKVDELTWAVKKNYRLHLLSCYWLVKGGTLGRVSQTARVFSFSNFLYARRSLRAAGGQR